ncbi:MAG: hypothetical protein IRZ03_14890 [Acidobacterium ailaaui]|nr:hypothetical protein [Pseudacidobacterium ailaaui]
MLIISSFLLTLELLAALHSSAVKRLPAILADNLLPQQRSDGPLLGRALHNVTVHIITFRDYKDYMTHADHAGQWYLIVRTSAGNLYEKFFSDRKNLVLKKLLNDEAWVSSDQSDMEISLKGYSNMPIWNTNGILTIVEDPQLSLCYMQSAVLNTLVDNCKGAWEVSKTGIVASFSAVNFQFVKKLWEIIKLSVGIIDESRDDTHTET